MAGEIAYKLTADEAQALQAVARLSREFGLNETAIKKAVEASKELDRTQQQMGREGQRVFEETRTELEKYELGIKRLKELYEAGKIDAETYGRAVVQAHEKNEQALNKQAQAHKSAFGEEARQSLQQYGTAASLIGNSIGAILEHMKALVALRKEAGQLDRSAEMAEGSLAEVAGGDVQQYQKLLAKSRGIAAKSGMSRQQAAALTFAAASAGATDQMDVFADLYGQGVVQDPEALMRATQTLQTSMGRKQTGSLRDITSKLLAAGEHSPQKIAQLGPAAALAGVNAQDAGVSTDELLAAVAVESKATGDAAIAGTMQKSLQKALARLRSGKDEEGKELATDEEGHLLDQSAKATRAAVRHKLAGANGLMGELHAVQSLGLDDAALQKLFGRQEGLMAYKVLLRNEGEFNEAKTSIGGAAGKDLAGRVLALPGTDAQANAAKTLRTETESANVALAGSQIGATQNVVEAAFKHIEADYASGKLKTKRWVGGQEGEINQLRAEEEGTVIPAKAALRMRIRKGELDDDPRLLKQAVEALGGEKAVFGEMNWHGGDADVAKREHYREITKDLKDASTALKNSQQRPRPTLVAPNVDK